MATDKHHLSGLKRHKRIQKLIETAKQRIVHRALVVDMLAYLKPFRFIYFSFIFLTWVNNDDV